MTVHLPISITEIYVADHGELEAELLVYGEIVLASRRSGSWVLLDDTRQVQPLAWVAARLEEEAQKQKLLDKNWNLVSGPSPT